LTKREKTEALALKRLNTVWLPGMFLSASEETDHISDDNENDVNVYGSKNGFETHESGIFLPRKARGAKTL